MSEKIPTKFGNIPIVVDERIQGNEVVIGYPDGKGGFRDGWVKLTNVGETERHATRKLPIDDAGKSP